MSVESFGQKLKDLRARIGKTQVEVSAEIAVMFPDIRISQTTLSAWEQRDSAPRGEVLEYLAQYFSVPQKYFFEGNEEHSRLALAKAHLERLRQAMPNGKAE